MRSRINRIVGARAPSEDELLSYDCLLPLKSCVVCRLGEGVFAERMWNAWQRGTYDSHGLPDPTDGDPYLDLVSEWG